MTVTVEELEKFMQVFENQGIEKISSIDLRKAIRHYWDVASQPTVKDRVTTLEEEGWIEKIPHSDNYKVNHKKNDSGFENLFREARHQG